jgi:WD40 repeat protein
MQPRFFPEGPVVQLMLTFAMTLGGASYAVPTWWGRLPEGSALEKHASGSGAQQNKDTGPTDAHGDPLPPNALMRLGSARLQHALTCTGVAFSPIADILASSGRDGAVRLWDPSTGKELRHIGGPQEGVLAIAYSPSGKLLAGAGGDGVVYLWDAATGNEVRRLQGHKNQAVSLAFAVKGDVLAVGDAFNIRLWQVDSGKLLQVLESKSGRVESVSLTPDGRHVAAAGMGIRETAGGNILHGAPAWQPYSKAVIFSPDGQFLITVGATAIIVWETVSGKQVDRLNGPGQRGACLALAPDGRTVAIGGSDGVLRLWDWTNAKEIRKVGPFALGVEAVAFSRDGQTLASAGGWGTISLWDVATGQPKTILSGHRKGLTGVAYAPSAARIATTGWDGTVRLWDARSGKEVCCLAVPQAELAKTNLVSGGFQAGVAAAMLQNLVLSPDGQFVAVSRWDHTVMVWDVATGNEVKRFVASRLAFSPDNRLFASIEHSDKGKSSNPEIIGIYDRATGKPLRKIPPRLGTLWFDSLHFLPDSQTLIAIAFSRFTDKTGRSKNMEAFVVAWDARSGEERRSFRAGVGTNHEMTLSPDGRTLAIRQFVHSEKGLDGSAIILWEMASGGRRGELVGHKGWVNGIAFSPDGRRLASGGMDSVARLWDWCQAKEIGHLKGHRGWVHQLTFAPDGKTLVTVSTDTTALIWDLHHLLQPAATVELSAADLEGCWKDLSGDADLAFRALGKLLLSPGQTVKLLDERLKPAPVANGQRLARLIGALDSDQFQTRDQAEKELEDLGEAAGEALEKALAGKVTLEAKRRLEGLLERLNESHLPPEKLRQVRAVEALEQIGTAEVSRLLIRLVASGAPGARLTREAEATLARLKARGR